MSEKRVFYGTVVETPSVGSTRFNYLRTEADGSVSWTNMGDFLAGLGARRVRVTVEVLEAEPEAAGAEPVKGGDDGQE